jgi:hypothetical protein
LFSISGKKLIDEEKFRNELKKSVMMKDFSTVEDGKTYKNKRDALEHIDLLHKRLKTEKKKQVFCACLIGNAFSHLKKLYGKTMRQMYKEIEEKTGYKKSYVCFLIALAEFATTYNRVAYITLSLHSINKHFKLIKKIVEEDKNFWTHVV